MSTMCVPPSERDRAFDAFDREVGEAMGLHNAAHAGLVEVVGRCLGEGWWQDQQTHSPEHWCKVRLGVGAATASKLVRCARELPDYPRVAAAFAAGQLSIDHVDVIVGHAHPCFDRDIAESAPTWDVARMRRIIANLPIPKHDPEPPPPPEPDEPAPDAADEPTPDEADEPAEPEDVFRAGWGDDGRYRGCFDLSAGVGGVFEKALAVARGALFTARTGVAADDDDRVQEPTIISGLDALARMLHAALDGLDPALAAGRRPGERTQVIVHLDAEHPERARLHLGPLLAVSVTQAMLCDADLRLAIRERGKVVALGRRSRTVDERLRVLIEHRDQGCRVDGCGRRGFLHIHHLVHWADGGPTDPDNLVAVCPEHHRMVHAGTIRLSGDPSTVDGLLTLDRHGRPLPRPSPVPPAGPLPPAPSFYRGTHWGERISFI